MEDLEYEVEKKEYTPKRKYYLFEWMGRGIFFGLGVWISFILYNQCLFNPDCNTIVTIYFAVLGLTCFLHAGFSIDKLANIKLT
ncbi:MAG: hypothetical protein AB1414_17125 [bacterium]